MAESEAQDQQNGEQGSTEQNAKDGTSKFELIGIGLEKALIFIFMLHGWLIAIVEEVCSKHEYYVFQYLAMTIVSFTPSMTTASIVVTINIVGDMYHEIQSWEVCYITWSICVSIAYWISAVFYEDTVDPRNRASKWLLRPFGIKPSDAKDSFMWSITLVSFAVAMVAGFLANFALEKKYHFQCHHSEFDSISDVCYKNEEICCIAISSHTKPITFLSSLASTILAAWGVIKVIGYLICISDPNVVEDHTEEVMEILESVKGSQSLLKMLKETIDLAQKEEAKKAEPEAGCTDTKVYCE